MMRRYLAECTLCQSISACWLFGRRFFRFMSVVINNIERYDLLLPFVEPSGSTAGISGAPAARVASMDKVFFSI